MHMQIPFTHSDELSLRSVTQKVIEGVENLEREEIGGFQKRREKDGRVFFGCESRETSCGSGPDRAQHAVPHSRQQRHNQRCCRSLLSSSTLSSTVHAARGGAFRTLPCFFSNQILILLSFFHIECFFF